MQKIKIPMEIILTLIKVVPNKSLGDEISNIYIKNGNIYGTDGFILVQYKEIVPPNVELVLPRQVLGGFKKTYLKKENIVELEEKDKGEVLLTIKSINDQEVIRIVYKHPQTKLIDTVDNFVQKIKNSSEYTGITTLGPSDISPLFAEFIRKNDVSCDIKRQDQKIFFFGETREIVVIKRIF